MNDFYKVGNALYRIVIEPERHPINNSPWYAFKVWSNTPKTIHLQLTYKHGDHRYRPRLSKDREHWYPIDADNINTDTSGRATLTLDLDEEPLWVSAQELITSKNMQQWADSIANNTSALLDTIGQSHQQRPILKLTIGKAPSDQRQGVLVITSRQHPPEVTGEIASKEFIETLLEDDKLAQEFRQQFEVWAYPIVNPDGVDLGQWRNNAGGNDLNRDWKNFNQPETKSIHDDLAPLADNENRKVFYGSDRNLMRPCVRMITVHRNFVNNSRFGLIQSSIRMALIWATGATMPAGMTSTGTGRTSTSRKPKVFTMILLHWLIMKTARYFTVLTSTRQVLTTFIPLTVRFLPSRKILLTTGLTGCAKKCRTLNFGLNPFPRIPLLPKTGSTTSLEPMRLPMKLMTMLIAVKP